MKRKTSLLIAFTMIASLYGCGANEADTQETVEQVEESTTEETVETDNAEAESQEGYSLAPLEGTYVELFPEFAKEEYKDWWVECISAYETDEDTVESFYTMLTESYMGTITGQEAVEKYSADSMVFDCYFENDIKTITVDGNVISGADDEGNEIFSHEYSYVEDIDALHGEDVLESYFHVFKTEDEDAGEFTYFVFTNDTPSGEYHIEFRYGESLEGMDQFMDGNYAYWMASGILQDYDEEMIHNCIKLFVDENVGGEE
ncbi:hypothetical protein [Pseudobutyrivibrio ruminis]|uniref:Lipoprotein n=1 Tax=Pseudobutyrivibrio ruminis DSM 9787 TaxID=1123011 RepID=A0A285SMY7_9FIRM|nr:hypothetical protein [Pseudobutyrivibrio ruminis]SOC09124.1 hypothetical protein SAMN02910411_2586 [Pseudobutyrivibrio ruminis DSM 9787]